MRWRRPHGGSTRTSWRTCTQARDAFTALDQSTDERFGRDAPSLTAIRKALDDCRLVIEPIVEAKRELEPSPDDEPEADDEAGADTEDEPADEVEPVEREAPAQEAAGLEAGIDRRPDRERRRRASAGSSTRRPTSARTTRAARSPSWSSGRSAWARSTRRTRPLDPSHAGGPVERDPPGPPSARERGGVGGAPRAGRSRRSARPEGRGWLDRPSLRGRGDGLLGPRSLRGRRRRPRACCGPSSPTTPTCPTPS